MPDRRSALLSFAALALAGCGPGEASQAAALQRFLQTRILDRQGLAVPRPTEEERAGFGRFAMDYEVILAFHDKMSGAVIPRIGDVVRRGSFNRAQDFLDRRADIAAAREAMRTMAATLDGALATATAAKAQLKQPDTLKATYDQAFARVVSTPADVMRSVMPAADEIFAQGLAFSDFLSANRADFKLEGPVVETSKANLLEEFNRRAQGLQAAGETLLSAQRRLQVVLRGQ